MGTHPYRISVAGHLGRLAQDAFGGMKVVYDNGHTDLYGELDQSALFGLLARVQTLALELVAVRREEPTGWQLAARDEASRETAVAGAAPHASGQHRAGQQRAS